MKSLSKSQLAERDELDTKLQEKAQLLKDAVEAFNTALVEAWKQVEEAQTAYNAVIDEANTWQSGVMSEMEAYQQERSDKWQEGDAGQAYQGWMDAYSEELEEIELEMPAELDEPDLPEYPLADRPEKPE